MKAILLLIALSILSFTFPARENIDPKIKGTDSPLKLAVFEILKNKCNACHQYKNKKRVFTLENMEGYGKKIYNQVFKWKRMPKGNAIKLTDNENTQLKNWINSLNIK